MIDATVADLMFEAAWKSVLVAGAVLLLLAMLKRRSAAERACLAHFGMAAVLLLPLMIVVGPSLELLPARETAVTSAPVSAQLAARLPIGGEEEAGAPFVAAPGAAAVEPDAAWVGAETGLAFYLAPAALLMLLTFVSILRLFALRRRANVIVQQNWLTALAHAQRRMGIKSGTALLVSEELSSPVSWGILRPIILLSEDALDNPVDAEAIIAHELAHVARFDWLNLLLARVATAMFWFNPLVWLLARQGHQLREEAADDAVLRADVPNVEYAALLVGAARHEGRGILLAANGVAPGKGSLSLRVRRILEPALRRGPVRLAWGASCAAGALVVAGPLAALTSAQGPAPAPLARPDRVSSPAYAAIPFPPAPAAAPAPVPAPDAPAPAAVAVAAVPSAPLAASPPSAAPPPAPPAPAMAVAVAHARPSAEELVAMSIHGVTPEFAQAVAATNSSLAGLTPRQLTSLRVHGVTVNRLRQWAALGYRNLGYDQVVAMAVHGVTPSYIRSLAEHGYRGLSVDRLVEMRIHGVNARLISRVKSRVVEVSPDELINIAVTGAHPPDAPRVPRPPSTPGRP